MTIDTTHTNSRKSCIRHHHYTPGPVTIGGRDFKIAVLGCRIFGGMEKQLQLSHQVDSQVKVWYFCNRNSHNI
jgi:hypothetical protein